MTEIQMILALQALSNLLIAFVIWRTGRNPNAT
ncbi:hypothetical protein AB7M47_006241 [Bradyrhizobium elkanii]